MSAADVEDQALVDDDRFAFHRGPCRGDGHRRRSAEWYRLRDEALTRPCPFVLVKPAPRGAADKSPRRLACGADVGELCRDPETGEPWTDNRQPAHIVRLKPTATPIEEPSP